MNTPLEAAASFAGIGVLLIALAIGWAKMAPVDEGWIRMGMAGFPITLGLLCIIIAILLVFLKGLFG